MNAFPKQKMLSGMLTLGVLLAWRTAALADGIPEPGLTMYGVVKNDIGGAHVRVTSGNVVWTIVPPSGPPVTVTTELKNINEQFSYVLEVPFETAVPGSPPTTNALRLRATATVYDRSAVMVGTNSAAIVGKGATFVFTHADRASVERVDLDVSIAYPDRDSDGLPDFWEDLHFSGFADPNDDPDGDGLSNLKEYLSGCNPNNPASAFEFVKTEPASAGGFVISWSSQPGRSYRLERSEDLLAGFTPLRNDIPSTPPLNTYTDSTGDGEGPYFYRVIIE